MRLHRSLILSVLTIAIVLGLVSPSLADILLTRRRDADEFVFQSRKSPGAKNQKVEIWIGPDRVRRDDGHTALILRLDQKKLYLIEHADKTYTATDLRQKGDQWVATATFNSSTHDREIWQLHAKVEPTGETRKIGAWQAAGHRVTFSDQAGIGARLRLEWWAAPGLKIDDAPLRTLLRLLASFVPQGDEWMATVLAVPGHAVLYQRVEQQPEVEVKIREELESVKEGEAPAGTYDPPKGYRLMDLGEYRSTYGWPGPL